MTAEEFVVKKLKIERALEGFLTSKIDYDLLAELGITFRNKAYFWYQIVINGEVMKGEYEFGGYIEKYVTEHLKIKLKKLEDDFINEHLTTSFPKTIKDE